MPIVAQQAIVEQILSVSRTMYYFYRDYADENNIITAIFTIVLQRIYYQQRYHSYIRKNIESYIAE